MSVFLFVRKGLEQSNAACQWHAACRRLDGGESLIFSCPQEKMQTSPFRQTRTSFLRFIRLSFTPRRNSNTKYNLPGRLFFCFQQNCMRAFRHPLFLVRRKKGLENLNAACRLDGGPPPLPPTAQVEALVRCKFSNLVHNFIFYFNLTIICHISCFEIYLYFPF